MQLKKARWQIFFLLFCTVPGGIAASPYQSEDERGFYEALHAGDRTVATNRFHSILKTPKKFQYIDEYQADDLPIYLDTLSCENTTPDLAYAIAFIYVEEIDARYDQPHKGTTVPVSVQGRYSDGATVGISDSVNLSSRFYACSPDVKIHFTPHFLRAPQVKLTEIRTKPFRETGQIALNLPILANTEAKTFVEKHLDEFDFFVFVIPSERKGLSTASMKVFKNAEGKSARRGIITIGIERIRVTQTLIHEIFHVLEQAAGNRVPHLYETKQKKSWPKWYTGKGQLNYYRGFLKDVWHKKGAAALKLR